ncbi:Uncharacterized protein SCF082_LOCUS17376 [Durusdinium trenchii]|uniref:Ubiquitin-like domain-containing protein n=2 Tax=Durusdinium trenchii TaxID=1381693 RepID=A0ABP0KIU2_9DINO
MDAATEEPTGILVQGSGLSYSCQVVCNSNSSIREVKRLFEAETGIPATELRLFLGDKELRDLQRLGNLQGTNCDSSVELSFLRREPEQAKWLEAVVSDDDGSFLAEAPSYIRADREVVMAAVMQNGRALEFASEKLRADREIVLLAVDEDPNAFQFASSELHADRDVMLAAVQRNGLALQFAVDELRDDEELVKAAVSHEGLALRYASSRCQADRQIALIAVDNDVMALRYVARDLQADALQS